MIDDPRLLTADLRGHYRHSRSGCTKAHVGRTPARYRTHEDWVIESYNVIGDENPKASAVPVKACGCSHVNITSPDGRTVRLIGPTQTDGALPLPLVGRGVARPADPHPPLADAINDHALSTTDRWGWFLSPISAAARGYAPSSAAETEWRRIHALHALITGDADHVEGWTTDTFDLVHLIDWYFAGIAENAGEAHFWAAADLTADKVAHWRNEGVTDRDVIREWAPHFDANYAQRVLRKHFPDVATARQWEHFASDLTFATLVTLREGGTSVRTVGDAFRAVIPAVHAIFGDEATAPAWARDPVSRTPTGEAVLIHLTRPLPPTLIAGLVKAGVTAAEVSDADRETLDLMAALA